MTNRLHNVESLERSPIQRKLLWINTVIGCLALFSNGAALMFVLSGKAPEIAYKMPIIVGILTLALVVIVTGLFGLKTNSSRPNVLAIHSIIFAAAALGDFIWGLNLIGKGSYQLASEGVRTTWSVGWFTALSAYAAYLVTETFLVRKRENALGTKYSFLWVGAIAFAFDIFVFSQLAASIH